MKKVNVYVNSVLRWSAYKKDDEYQAWIDYAVANNLWGQPGTYTVEVVDATAELEQKRAELESTKKSDFNNHANNTENPHAVTKAQVGLDLVDNTSDLSKPISTQMQSALDLKADSSDINSALALKANLSSVYTKTESDTIASNTLSAANSYADIKTAAIVNSAPATLDTLNELATALGDDPNFATTTATLIGTKADSSSVYTKAESDTNYESKNANIQSHISSLDNPHSVTKSQIGLSNVDDISAADLRDRSTHIGNEFQLTWSEGAAPSTPATGLTTYSRDVGGRNMFSQLGRSGVYYSFQPHVARNKIFLYSANGNATTTTVIGGAAPTVNGTATTRTVATTNRFTWFRRVGFVSNTTGNSSCGVRAAAAQYGIGNLTGVGGFHFIARFGISDAVLVPGARMFVGMTSSTAVLGNTDPSAFTNIIGVGMDISDTTLQIMHNDGAGTATKIDLGASFPESTNQDMYELVLFCAPNGVEVSYQVTNLSTGVETRGDILTNLPLNTQLLAWQLWRHNVNTGIAVGLDVSSVYIETDN